MVRNIGLMVSLPKKSCEDKLCPFHGSLSVRGRLYIGIVESNKSPKMIVVSREYNRLVKKYKRYERSKSKVHAFLPDCIGASEGQKVKIAECRPLSKTVSFVVVEGDNKDGV
ncbi:MAG TPA: 30S ribosomal protein S17 [Nitrososphaeraceae archaeon]|nr:30S ribosomal protein S17 [Nitrososphaeraceae archaeon]